MSDGRQGSRVRLVRAACLLRGGRRVGVAAAIAVAADVVGQKLVGQGLKVHQQDIAFLDALRDVGEELDLCALLN